MITNSQADYLITLVVERISELERRQKVVLTPQDEHEIVVELERARGVVAALSQ